MTEQEIRILESLYNENKINLQNSLDDLEKKRYDERLERLQNRCLEKRFEFYYEKSRRRYSLRKVVA